MPLVLDGTNGVSGVDGTASNPAIEGTDSNTGIFYPAADTVAIGTGGTEALRVNSSQNIGFGVTPSASTVRALQVPNNTVVGSQGVNLNATANAYFDSSFKYHTTGVATWYQQSSGQHAWYNAPSGTAGANITFTQAMTLDASGRLGLGTSSPSNRLDVQAVDGIGSITSTTGTNTANWRVINSGGTLFMGIDSSTGGNFTGTAYAGVLWHSGNYPLVFATNNTPCARFTSSGTFLINTTTALGTDKFIVAGPMGIRGTVSTNAGDLQFYRADTGTKAWSINANINDFYIADADFSNYAYLTQNPTQWNFASDIRIKENIIDLDYGLSTVMTMQPRRFNFIGSDDVQIGFIAQELREVVPEAVSGKEAEFLETDTPQERATKTLGVGKETLIPVLVKAIQELNAKVEAQAAEIAALKGNA